MPWAWPLFFFRAVSQINTGFPNLLGADSSRDDGDGEGEDDGEGEGGPGTFNDRWGWIANVDRAAEVLRCSWDEVWEKPAVEFLNTLAYSKDKTAWEAEALERWKRTH